VTIIASTITVLPEHVRGRVVVCGSHGGRYPGYRAALSGLRAVILHDAGVGKDAAGIGALPYLEDLGIAAATVSHRSCRIGAPDDMLHRGVISHANDAARSVGVHAGQPCEEAAARLEAAPAREVAPPAVGEGRSEVATEGGGRIVLLDSAAMVTPDDVGAVVVTGSHGALAGGDPAKALQVAAWAAVFNDAGFGGDDLGVTRLWALEGRGIAAFTVATESARIGEAHSSYQHGVISAMNELARRAGAGAGREARPVLVRWAEAIAERDPSTR
jgi:hypothetical protein